MNKYCAEEYEHVFLPRKIKAALTILWKSEGLLLNNMLFIIICSNFIWKVKGSFMFGIFLLVAVTVMQVYVFWRASTVPFVKNHIQPKNHSFRWVTPLGMFLL